MYWHIDTDIVSLIVITIVYICNRKMPPQEKDSIRNRRFMHCLETGIVVTIIDIAASIIMEIPTPNFIYHLFMTAYFICIELVMVEWFLYALTILYQENEKGRRFIRHFVLLFFALYTIFSCLNPWTGYIYSLSPSGEYSRGPLFSAVILLYSAYAISLFVIIVLRWKKIPQSFPREVLLMTPVIIAIGIVVQLLIPGWLLIISSYMICLLLAFLFLQTIRAQTSQKLVEDLWAVAETDNLTGLYNRTGMEAMVRQTSDNSPGESVVVLIVDIDNLKLINDTMGHGEGDRAIQMVGAQLKKHFRSNDTVVRYGGDEFLVFFTGYFEHVHLGGSLQKLIDEISQLNIGENNDVPIHGSIGAAFGIVGTDTFDSLCSKADIALYYVKRNGKNGYAFYKPDMED